MHKISRTSLFTLLVGVFFYLSLPALSFASPKDIDVEKDIFNNIKKQKKIVSKENKDLKEIKKYLNDDRWVIDSVTYKGTVASDGIQYDFPGGVTYKDGVLHYDKDKFSKPIAVASALVRNPDDKEAKLTAVLRYDITEQETWQNSFHINVTGTMGTKTLLSESSIAVEVGYDFTKTTSKGKSLGWELRQEIPVEPRSKRFATLSINMLDLPIPYHYTVILSGKTIVKFRPKVEGAQLFKDTNYKGGSHTFKAGKNKITTFDSKDFKKHGMDDKTSSMKILGNVKVSYYDNPDCTDYRGQTTEDISWTGKHNNDEISCIKIKRLGKKKEISVNLENILVKSARTFTVNGVWQGVKAFDSVIDLGKNEPLDSTNKPKIKNGRLEDRVESFKVEYKVKK